MTEDRFNISDARLKHDILPLDVEESLEKIKQLCPKRFTFNGVKTVGFLAQDVLLVDPSSVKTSVFHKQNSDEETDMYPIMSLSYVDLFVHHIAAFQAQVTRQRNFEMVMEQKIYEMHHEMESLKLLLKIQTPLQRDKRRDPSPMSLARLDEQHITL